MNMDIVPTEKNDLDACHRLAEATDEQVILHIDSLLEWTQDVNWPVAPLVIRRLSTLGSELKSPINKILGGSDSTWKYFVITNLLPKLKPEIKIGISHQLKKLVGAPSETDKQEQVNVVAQEFLNGL